jgi:hypothetical protein
MVKKSKISRAIDYEIEEANRRGYEAGSRFALVVIAVLLAVIIALALKFIVWLFGI